MNARLFILSLALTSPLFAGANRWTEGGPPRAECSPRFIHCSEITSLAIDPFDNRTLYATMTSGGPYDAIDPHGLWRSSDGGDSWTRLNLTPLNSVDSFVDVQVSPSNPHLIYVLSESAFHTSTDGGSRWTRSLLPEDYLENTDLAIDSRGRLYVGQRNFCMWGSCIGGGVYRSDDGGRRWRAIGLNEKTIDRIAIDPSDPAIIYAVSDGRLFETRNGGNDWRDVSPRGLEVISMVAIDPVIPSTIYAVTGTFSNAFAGVFKSTDRGLSWRLINDADFREGGPNVIAIDPMHPLNLLATTGYGRLVRSADGGETWTAFHEGLPGDPEEVVIDATGKTFHVIATDGYIFQYTLVPGRRRAVSSGDD